MLMTMDPDIQKNLEQIGAYDMLKELKMLYAQQAEQKLLQTVREFHVCKQEEGQSVSSYILKMKSYIDNLKRIGYAMTQSLVVSLILVSLRMEYHSFVQNYNMQGMRKTMTELHAMLKLHEQTLSQKDVAPALHAIRAGRMARKPYSHQVERAKDLLGLIHTDLCDPFRTVSRQGASYFITCTDDFSRYGYIYLLKHKHEVFETFKVFQKEVKNQLRKTIKSLCSDRRGEYMSQDFLDHLNEHGIISHRTAPYTPQHNGVSERRNRTLLDMALVKRDTLTKPDKLEPRSIKCIFVGYPKETMRYSFYYPPKNKVFVARNAKFFKNSLITQEASGSLEDLDIIQEEDAHPSIETSLHHNEDDQKVNEPQSNINAIRKSTRTRRASDRMCLHINAEEHELGDLGEPANDKAALLDLESDKWINAMNVEM
uniref:Retrotransposon protein, putative, Ty1-copia subclass n=1 Tax=Tanacetum cinerariifolium TaxID=118510 RepID=A0A699GTQ0_TANCI|nr:retrotransposon protein, putative, Ty1-copia subclass [Tanacetum cinerariifolium]